MDTIQIISDKYGKFIWLLLFILLLVLANALYRSKQGIRKEDPKDTYLVVLADRNKPMDKFFISRQNVKDRKIEFNLLSRIDGDTIQKKSIKSFPFPFKNNGNSLIHYQLRNLVENQETGNKYFINYGNNDYEWLCYEILYLEKLKNIDIKKKPAGRFIVDGYITGFDEKKNLLLTHKGDLIDIINGKDSFCIDDIESSSNEYKFKHLPTGSSYGVNGSILLQGPGPDEVQIGEFRYCSNSIVYINNSVKKVEPVNSGLCDVWPWYKSEQKNPIGISPTANMVAFWSIFPNKQKNSPELWLSIWNLDNDKIEKVTKLPFNPVSRRYGEPFIKWNPNSALNLITITTGQGEVVIVNIKEKSQTVISKSASPKSIRWSVNGNKLCYLDDGEIWVYDVKKESLKMIDKDPDYFDFFWVEK